MLPVNNLLVRRVGLVPRLTTMSLDNYLINFIFLLSSSCIVTIADSGATGIISGCNVVLFIVRVKNLPFPKLLLSVMLIQREALVSPLVMLT